MMQLKSVIVLFWGLNLKVATGRPDLHTTSKPSSCNEHTSVQNGFIRTWRRVINVKRQHPHAQTEREKEKAPASLEHSLEWVEGHSGLGPPQRSERGLLVHGEETGSCWMFCPNWNHIALSSFVQHTWKDAKSKGRRSRLHLEKESEIISFSSREAFSRGHENRAESTPRFTCLMQELVLGQGRNLVCENQLGAAFYIIPLLFVRQSNWRNSHELSHTRLRLCPSRRKAAGDALSLFGPVPVQAFPEENKIF